MSNPEMVPVPDISPNTRVAMGEWLADPTPPDRLLTEGEIKVLVVLATTAGGMVPDLKPYADDVLARLVAKVEDWT
ncbi:hypothetical protein ACFUN8_35855 [Streptomyces sp. NPDC057307]|uniref:hypothetical protein n=1 Tax=Streptomyces sp. NPDC057307 TaxID=3346096 RepID=UPI003625A787